MLRALAAAVVLAAVAAACGGTSVDSAALNDARGFGVKHPRMIRVERERLSTGYVHDVVLVRGRFCGHSGASTRPRPGPCGETVAEFLLTPGAHRFAGVAIGIPRGEEAKVAAARRASPELAVFPDLSMLLVRCRVPRRLVPGGVAGTCYSLPRRTGVAFIAHWPLSKPYGTRNVGGWVVRLGAGGRVLGIKLYRHGPPSAWK